MSALRPILPRAWPAILCAGAGLLACGEGDLEVRGALDRVIGETVTFELLEGERDFSGEIELRDAGRATFNATALKATKLGERKLSCVVPVKAAQGAATAYLGDGDDAHGYAVALSINRLALALDAKGAVEQLPLPPATLVQSNLSGLNASGGLIALTPSGGELALLAKDQLQLLSLGQSPRLVGPAIQQKGGRALAAVPNGALVCTDTSVILIKYIKGQASQVSHTFSGCKAIATDDAGTWAAVLSSCDTNSDSVQEDCLTTLQLASTISQQKQFSLDTTPSATAVSLRGDAKGAVVADANAIYGVWLDTSSPKVVAVPWTGISAPAPVGLDRGPSNLGELFAVGESSSKQVWLLGFDPAALYDLKRVSALTLPEAPTALAYGRDSQLVVASARKLYEANARQPNPKASLIAGVTPAANVLGLVVQP